MSVFKKILMPFAILTVLAALSSGASAQTANATFPITISNYTTNAIVLQQTYSFTALATVNVPAGTATAPASTTANVTPGKYSLTIGGIQTGCIIDVNYNQWFTFVATQRPTCSYRTTNYSIRANYNSIIISSSAPVGGGWWRR